MLKFLQKIKPLWVVLRFMWRRIASQRWFMPLIVLYIKLRVSPFASSDNLKKSSKNKVTLLATNHERFAADLRALSQHKDVYILTLPFDVQALINTIFMYDLEPLLGELNNVDKSLAYRKGTIPEIRQKQERLEQYLCELIPQMQKALKIDAFVTCSFFYIVDLSWQVACQKINFPFIALHKECMQDPVVMDGSIKRYSSMGMEFFGQKLIVYNNLARQVILQGNICDDSRIAVTGACRMDPLVHRIKSGQAQTPRRRLTHISSHHAIGLLTLKEHTGYFSHSPDDGFVKYFDVVHSQIARFADKHPDIEVFIKPKWGGVWIEKIEDLVLKATGKKASEIENLNIVWDYDAQALIESSAVVTGINSTALLEALMMGRPVVLPLFEEAAGKYYDNHVYFKKYQDQVFDVVRDPELLEAAILDKINNNKAAPQMPEEMIQDYLGYFDDHSTDRVVEEIVATCESLKKTRNSA